MKGRATISVVIITYNRPADMLELARNIAQLQHTELLAEVVIVNNRSTESYQEVEDFIAAQPQLPFRYYLADRNLGVSGGRNYAIRKSTGDLLLFLDDDALFENLDALSQLEDIFSGQEDSGRPVGIASFRVFYHATHQLQVTAFAHKQFERRKDWPHFETAYFVGCAHAIRREVFDRTGYYPEDFFYGMEEYDLSYRTLDAGFSIVYDNRIVILHKESPSGRLTNRDKLRGMWVNKSKVAYKYLPKIYFYSTACMWSLEYLKKTRFDLGGWWKGWRSVWRIGRTEKRKRVSANTLHYLRQVEARLWY